MKTFIDLVSYLISARGPVDNKIGMEKIVKFFVAVELLIQQSAAASATREEVEQNQLAFFFGGSDSIIQAALKPVLGDSE
jgi:hypothetical protein